MNETALENFRTTIESLREEGCYRQLPRMAAKTTADGAGVTNFSSNDYLGLAENSELALSFFQSLPPAMRRMGASSSRLMLGAFDAHEALEAQLCHLYGTTGALVFNSGYHLNTGILPAVCNSRTLILADRLVHASIIDGIRLSGCRFIRYQHNNYQQLAFLVEQNRSQYETIIIVTESIFSMDGDEADLSELISIKKAAGNVLLYLDEAHAVGVRGASGLGCAGEKGCMADIDFLAGTFGKAFASVGAFVVCCSEIREILINKMRPFIFSTALPPLNIQWTSFVLERIHLFSDERRRLELLGQELRSGLEQKGYQSPSVSHIVPVIIGDVFSTLAKAEELQANGFHVLAIRPPTVPAGTSRLRLSLSAMHTSETIRNFLNLIE